MFHLVKLVFLLSILTGTANAQWGTVVAQPDTNRFINSQQDFGLIMPHQQVVVGLLDTTITSVGIGGGNASQVIVGSLLDHEDNCANYTITNGVASCAGSYEKWRELEKSTSWYQADRGDTTRQFPTNYAVTITTGQDSVVIWNRDTAELWMAFKGGASNLLRINPPSNPINRFAFKDGQFYAATESYAFGTWDMLESYKPTFYSTDGAHQLEGVDIQTRNDGTQTWGSIFGASTLAIVSVTVNAVAAVRDPFGLKDALGRPKHWWSASTDGGNSVYNPHANAIYDGNQTGAVELVAMNTRGEHLHTLVQAGGQADYVFYTPSIFKVTADSWSFNFKPNNSGVGFEKSYWGGGATFTAVAFSAPDPTTRNAAEWYVAWDGLARYTFGEGAADIGSRHRMSATVNGPISFGDGILEMALEDNTTDSSPYGNTMTANNSPGTVAAVFGNGYSSKGASSSLTKSGATGLDGGTASFWGSLWVYPTENTNGRVLTFNGDSNTDRLLIAVNVGASSIGFQYTDDGYSTLENATWSGTILQDKWTHIAFTRDSDAKLNVLWVNGIRAATDVALNEVAASLNWDDIGIGDDVNGGGQHFYGRIDDLAYGQDYALTDEVVARIHAEGRKKLGMSTPVFTRTPDDALLSNNVVDIDALDNGVWAVAFSDANTVQVFDGRVPVQQIAAPAGTVKSLALIQSPGTDSVGVAIGTTTNLKFVQPSVNLREAMAHQYKEPIHVGSPVVVDSAGVGGIFWTGDDAVDATSNANRSYVNFSKGTYGKFTIDHANMIVRGSGFDTVINGTTLGHAVTISAKKVSLFDLEVRTTPGGGNAYDGVYGPGGSDSVRVENVYCSGSDQHCFNISTVAAQIVNVQAMDPDGTCVLKGGDYGLIANSTCTFAGSDGFSVSGNGSVNRVIGNTVNTCGNVGLMIGNGNTGMDHNVFNGNTVKDCTGNSMQINSGSESALYNVCSGNRLDGAINGTCSDGNNTTAY